jgi:hypothetical protein
LNNYFSSSFQVTRNCAILRVAQNTAVSPSPALHEDPSLGFNCADQTSLLLLMLGYPRPNMTCRQHVCVREMMNQYSGIVLRGWKSRDVMPLVAPNKEGANNEFVLAQLHLHLHAFNGRLITATHQMPEFN